MKHPDFLIPDNEEGAKTDTSSTSRFPTAEEASRHFQICKERLLSVSRWHELAGAATASFQLTDQEGNEINRQVQKGDFFKISIPAPGSETGDGYDWVQVESIEEQQNTAEDWEYVLLTVHPASNPRNADPSTAHFFREEAASYFLVKRTGTEVSAEVHGRNEKPNTESETLKDKVRNTIVAVGAILGVSKAQWKSLTNGLISEKEESDR